MTYTLSHVCNKLGLTQSQMNELIANGFPNFPFSVTCVQTAKNSQRLFYCPKKQVDRYFEEGNKPPLAVNNKNRHKKSLGADYYQNFNFPVTKELALGFNEVVTGMNKKLGYPLARQEYLRLAIREFIDRRPEFMGGDTK